jgi:hypothetical protein
MTESALEEAVLQMLDGPGRQADASAYRTSLVLSGAVMARRGDDGTLRFKKAAEFPTWPENGPGSAAFDQQNREMAEEQERQHDLAAAEALRNSPQNRQREEWDAHIRQVADERIDARLDEVRRTYESASLTEARRLLKESTETPRRRPRRTLWAGERTGRREAS